MKAFKWEGDLNDDCSLCVGDLIAHAEALGDLVLESDDGVKEADQYWYCGVYRGQEQLFHSGEPGGSILGGAMARAICEAIIRAALRIPKQPF